jgi:hypothetical protein
MSKIDRTIVRNQPYRRGGISIRERHNERKNESYSNPDIEPERSQMNVQFRQCETTYEKALDRMLEQGAVSTRGLKPDAKVFEEMVFDVNTGYFESHGGYEYAKRFFEETFHFAEKEVGSRYILSAVMHADERNKGLSDELGRDVYHYHLHVIYIPVVDKVIKYSKRCRDPLLVGTAKEVIHQISHSKKWAYPTARDEFGRELLNKDGRPRRIPSYSLLQSRFFNQMRQAGFKDVERGTAEHQTVVEYKVEQEREKLLQLTDEAEKKRSDLTVIEQEIAKVEPVYSTHLEIDAAGKKRRLGGKVVMTGSEYEKLASLAKLQVSAQSTIDKLDRETMLWRRKFGEAQDAFDRLYDKTKPFLDAMKLAPQVVMASIEDVFQKDKEERERAKSLRHSSRPLRHTAERDSR